MTELRARTRSGIVALLWATLAAVCVWGFWATGRFHGGYGLEVVGLEFIPASELVFYMWYVVWGLPALVFATRALLESGLAGFCAAWIGSIPARAPLWIGSAAAAVTVAGLAFHFGITHGLPLSDDEHTYAFIAKTLLKARVVNPLPADPEFFRNVFVLVDSSGWYGKYPIGHPAALALGEAVGLRALVVPLLGGCNLYLTYVVGCAFFDRRTAVFGALLLLISPHFVWTHGTQMSQPTSMLCMLIGVATMFRAVDGASLGWALLSGVAWGAAALVRPMPGVLFLAIVPVAFLLTTLVGADNLQRQRRWLQLIGAGLPVVALAGLMLWVQFIQSGDPLVSGYETEAVQTGGTWRLLFVAPGLWASSLGGAALREAFWFLGWPLGAAFFLWARPSRMRTLFWGLLAAIAAYRVLVPKTVMSVTGPIYVTEALPLIALGTVDVLRRWSRLGVRSLSGPPTADGPNPNRARQEPAALAVALVLAGCLISAAVFVPVQLRSVRTSTELAGRVYRMLAERGVTRALVFANRITSGDDRRTWAYHPPNPSPDLDDDILFVRVPDGTGEQRREACVGFWKRHMPERRAFLFVPARDKLHLLELE